jgi:hypothetical protein
MYGNTAYLGHRNCCQRYWHNDRLWNIYDHGAGYDVVLSRAADPLFLRNHSLLRQCLEIAAVPPRCPMAADPELRRPGHRGDVSRSVTGFQCSGYSAFKDIRLLSDSLSPISVYEKLLQSQTKPNLRGLWWGSLRLFSGYLRNRRGGTRPFPYSI